MTVPHRAYKDDRKYTQIELEDEEQAAWLSKWAEKHLVAEDPHPQYPDPEPETDALGCFFCLPLLFLIFLSIFVY